MKCSNLKCILPATIHQDCLEKLEHIIIKKTSRKKQANTRNIGKNIWSKLRGCEVIQKLCRCDCGEGFLWFFEEETEFERPKPKRSKKSVNSKPLLVGANRQKTLSQGKFVDTRRALTTIIQTTASEPDRERVIPGLPP